MRTAWVRFYLAALIGSAACFSALPAWADLYSAQVAYEKKNFPKAFAEFKELAEVGQPRAQYNLAVMYARGEGVPVSFTYAHAWASLAGANGEAAGNALAEKLAPELTPTSLKISADLQAQFGQAALDAHLLSSRIERSCSCRFSGVFGRSDLLLHLAASVGNVAGVGVSGEIDSPRRGEQLEGRAVENIVNDPAEVTAGHAIGPCESIALDGKR